MDDEERKNTGGVPVHSYVDRKTHTVMARGQFDGLFQAYLDHARELGAPPSPEALAIFRDAMAAAVLQLALLPPDQYCSWTYNLREPKINIFLAGDNGDFNLTGRVYEEHVRTVELNRLFIETQRPHHEPARSVVDFADPDVLEAMRQYYARSLQMRAKVLRYEENQFTLIQGLPNVDRQWFAELDEARVAAMFDRGLEPIERRTYRFHCGCDVRRITSAVIGLFGNDIDGLFQGEAQVEVQCPRCGRHFDLDRIDVTTPEA